VGADPLDLGGAHDERDNFAPASAKTASSASRSAAGV